MKVKIQKRGKEYIMRRHLPFGEAENLKAGQAGGAQLAWDREMAAIPLRSESREGRTWMKIHLMGWFGIRKQILPDVILFPEIVEFTE